MGGVDGGQRDKAWGPAKTIVQWPLWKQRLATLSRVSAAASWLLTGPRSPPLVWHLAG